MINTAPENLDREKGSGALEGAKKEYVPGKINPEQNENPDTSKLDEKIENAEEWGQGGGDKNEKKAPPTTKYTNQKGFGEQTEEFAKNNPDKQNRIPAGKNISKDLNDPEEKNNIFGKISKRMLGKKNL